ncbi:sulfite oxidase-like, partial [Centruroides vittatus]|uniref:sulfite oxidase-like n=1 Tax=Centruroides vittatus TaxID=120091 RepID=UPI00350E9028
NLFGNLGFVQILQAISPDEKKYFGEEISNLPKYSAKEIAKHNTKEKNIWVSYKAGVYDITEFVDQHPGGDKILLASGGPIEPFWELYGVHKQDEILELLETFRIGNLSQEDRKELSNDVYANEPTRHPALKVCSNKPFNAETPLELLTEKFITPSSLFYVRNHLPVPQVNLNDYRLEIYLTNGTRKTFTIEHLKSKFPKHTITATIQCAGNRRSELNKVKEVKGLSWEAGAIGTATWSGVKLVDLLNYVGVDFNDEKIQHVHFEGLDKDHTSNVNYAVSVPAHKVLNAKSDVLLAYEMNGQPLLPDHGFPLRVVVPGVVGARNVKWLGKIILSSEESSSHWQQNDYKSFSPSVDWNNVDFSQAPAVQETPVMSVICDPLNNSTVEINDNVLKVKGYAYSGGGRKIIRVDVSIDKGKTWQVATLTNDNSSLYYSWAWALWEIDLPIEENTDSIEIICKAVDSSYNVQPETFQSIWNLRGLMGTAWHRVNVSLN